MILAVQFRDISGVRSRGSGHTTNACPICDHNVLKSIRIVTVVGNDPKKGPKKVVNICWSYRCIQKFIGVHEAFIVRSAGKVIKTSLLRCAQCGESAVGGLWISEFNKSFLQIMSISEKNARCTGLCELCFQNGVVQNIGSKTGFQQPLTI